MYSSISSFGRLYHQYIPNAPLATLTTQLKTHQIHGHAIPSDTLFFIKYGPVPRLLQGLLLLLMAIVMVLPNPEAAEPLVYLHPRLVMIDGAYKKQNARWKAP